MRYGRAPRKKNGPSTSKSRDPIRKVLRVMETSSQITDREDREENNERINISFHETDLSNLTLSDYSSLSTDDISPPILLPNNQHFLPKALATTSHSLSDALAPSQEYDVLQTDDIVGISQELTPSPSPKNATNYILLHSTSTIGAILANAAVLHIDCSRRLGPGIFVQPHFPAPPSLAPLSLQTVIPHPPYIDLIPIPPLRERLLIANDTIDPREIWNDLYIGDVKVWGSIPWEGNSWEISERFAVKWWFVMSDEVLTGTNFWRRIRGEEQLTMEWIKSRFRKGLLSVATY
ncbi:hypothetical protein B7463_g76, partial [Scytalidium lignicola]